METTQDVMAESSTALEVPRESEAYTEWRQTGKLPAPAEKPAAGSPGEAQSPSAPDKGEKPAPASEAGKGTQEKNKPRDNAAARLNDLLNDLREAGLTPAELKIFKQHYQRTAKPEQPAAEAPKTAPAETTGNPAGLKAPVKPKQEDFKTWEEFDAAKDKYYEDLVEFKFAKRVQDQQQEAGRLAVHQKMVEATTRYGAEAASIISSTARAIVSNPEIAQPVKAILNDSPVWSDLLYTLGSGTELEGFIELAKTDPGATIRKAVLMEQLVKEELAKGGKPAAGSDDDAARDTSGKFIKQTPGKKESDAPPPPRETSGRGTAPPDEVDRAVKANDARAYFRSKNEEEARRRRG